MGMTATLKRLLLPSEYASFDVDLRYVPIVRFLQRRNAAGIILDVGSGPYGLSAYFSVPVIGVDFSFESSGPSHFIPVVANNRLPFRDRTFDAVVSVDALEHVPRSARQRFVDELFRVSRRLVVIGFPEGDEAERHDAEMEAFYARQHTESHRFFVEHRTYGVPRPGEADEYFLSAANHYGRALEVQKCPNVNSTIRKWFMHLGWNRRFLVRGAYAVLSLLAWAEPLFSLGESYRVIYYVTLRDRPEGSETLKGTG
jgi:hypothetical protein